MHFPSHEQKQALLEPVLRLADQRLQSARRQGGARLHRALLRPGRRRGPGRPQRPRTCTAPRWRTSPSRAASPRGTPKLRVYNPRAEEHGWSSPHTVIEIVNDDMPFLVDSVTMEVNRQGYTLHLFVPPARSSRSATRRAARSRSAPSGKDGAARVAHPRRGRPRNRSGAAEGAGRGHRSRCSPTCAPRSRTGQPMRERMDAIVKELANAARGPRRGEETAEIRDFLAWAADHHFTFLGYRDYELAPVDGEDQLKIVPRSGLGVLREPQLGGVSAELRGAAARSCARSRASRACWCSPRPTRAPRCTAPATSTTSA